MQMLDKIQNMIQMMTRIEYVLNMMCELNYENSFLAQGRFGDRDVIYFHSIFCEYNLLLVRLLMVEVNGDCSAD